MVRIPFKQGSVQVTMDRDCVFGSMRFLPLAAPDVIWDYLI